MYLKFKHIKLKVGLSAYEFHSKIVFCQNSFYVIPMMSPNCVSSFLAACLFCVLNND